MFFQEMLRASHPIFGTWRRNPVKKTLIWTLLITQLGMGAFPEAAWAQTDTQPIDLNVENPETPGAEKDQWFSEHSEKAEKFTFKEIPRDLGLSMKESFWGWGALAFGLGAGLTGALYPLDNDVETKLGPDELFSHSANSVMNYAFAPYVYGGVSLIIWMVGAGAKHPKLALTGRALTESLFLSMAVTWITKLAFRRERPNGGSLSFPSGHTTAAFSSAAVLTVFYGWKGALPGYALATLVSLNRLDSHAHFLTDVVMGAVIGSVIGVGTAKFLRKDHPNLFIAPSFDGKNASVNVHYRF